MKKGQTLIFACWMIATVATLGSLFFSEIMQFPPCTLCWYQRIAMYPLVVVFLVGAFQSPKVTFAFALPIVSIGWIIALFHNLLHYKIVRESASPCMQGVSCATVYINWMGLITIPMLSFIAFTVLGILLVLIRKDFSHEK